MPLAPSVTVRVAKLEQLLGQYGWQQLGYRHWKAKCPNCCSETVELQGGQGRNGQRWQWRCPCGFEGRAGTANGVAQDLLKLRAEVRYHGPEEKNGTAGVRVDNTPPATRRFRLLNAAELKERPDPSWLIEDMLQRNTLALVVGDQASFKSFIVMDMALCIATGSDWQDHAAERGLVVYVSAEGGSGMGLRVEAWEVAHQQTIERCVFVADQAPQLLDRRANNDIDELLLSMAELPEQPVLVVIDTLAQTMIGGDENSTQDMGLYLASAERIRQATGATVVPVHHTNKNGSARGSSALLAAVHTIIEVSRERNSRNVLIRCGKQKDAAEFDPILLQARVVELGTDPTTGRVRSSLVLEAKGSTVAPAGALTLMPASLKALQALSALESAPYATWLQACGLAKGTFTHARQQLVKAGYVEQPKPGGPWCLTSQGSKVSSGSKQVPLGFHETSANGMVPNGSTTPLGVEPGTSGPKLSGHHVGLEVPVS